MYICNIYSTVANRYIIYVKTHVSIVYICVCVCVERERQRGEKEKIELKFSVQISRVTTKKVVFSLKKNREKN